MTDRSHAYLSEPTFQWQSALLCAELSQLAYQSDSAIKHLLSQRWGFQQSSCFDSRDSRGFIAVDDSVGVFVFRGITSTGDWLSKLTVQIIEMPYGGVNRGFYDLWKSLKTSVEQEISSLTDSVKTIWLAGHGTGGALATIAAAELQSNKKVAGAYTFGQPRVGQAQFTATIEKRYENSFFRFVNDDDLITRIPPGLLHCGRLIQFDSQSEIVSPFSEGFQKKFKSLSVQSIDAIKSQVGKILGEPKSAFATDQSPPFQLSLDAGLEGLIPSIRSHEIARYVAAIRRQIPNENTEVSMEAIISSNAQKMMTSSHSAAENVGLESVVSKGDGDELLPILMRTRSKSWMPYADLKINSRLGPIVTALATKSQIERLRKDPDVASIDISRDAGIHECAVSVPFVGGDAVHVPPLDERGSHVIVGLIDSGIDVMHQAFLDGNGKTRIVAIWNQRDSAGLSPKKFDPINFTQDYGTIYDQAAIQSFVDKTAEPSNALRDPQTHGTHVASIAAGRKVGGFAGGVAPEARIAVIIPNMQTNPGDPPSIGYSNSHVDALVFLRALAEKLDLPMAVNVSLGMNAGAHDGMSTLESAFDAITDNGRDAGIAIVKSAGNERGFAGHAKIQALTGGVATLTWISNDRFRLQDYIEVWYSGVDELEFILISPDGAKSVLVNSVNPKAVSIQGGNRCSLELTINHPDNGDNLLTIRIRPDTANIQTGQWKLDVIGNSVFSADGRVDAWVERDDKARAVSFTSGDNDEMTLSIPGTANSVITVAACEPSTPVKLTTNSSFGPTRKSSPKPELTAPGEKIVAALANDDSDSQATISLSGTSMAAPHVTGAIALAFSHRKKNSALNQLNAQQIRTALLKNLKNRTQIHNVGFGFGILNIKPFFESLL